LISAEKRTRNCDSWVGENDSLRRKRSKGRKKGQRLPSSRHTGFGACSNQVQRQPPPRIHKKQTGPRGSKHRNKLLAIIAATKVRPAAAPGKARSKLKKPKRKCWVGGGVLVWGGLLLLCWVLLGLEKKRQIKWACGAQIAHSPLADGKGRNIAKKCWPPHKNGKVPAVSKRGNVAVQY